MKALKRNNTWCLAPYTSSMNIVGCKWVFKVKKNIDDSFQRCKARLVAEGFYQNTGIDYGETFNPVPKALTIRIILTIVVTKNWIIG